MHSILRPPRIRPATRTEIIRSTPDTFLLSSLCAPLQNAFLAKLRNVFDVSASFSFPHPPAFRNFATDKRELTSTRRLGIVSFRFLFKLYISRHRDKMLLYLFRISHRSRGFSEICRMGNFETDRNSCTLVNFSNSIFRAVSTGTLLFLPLRLFLCLSFLHHRVRKHRV